MHDLIRVLEERCNLHQRLMFTPPILRLFILSWWTPLLPLPLFKHDRVKRWSWPFVCTVPVRLTICCLSDAPVCDHLLQCWSWCRTHLFGWLYPAVGFLCTCCIYMWSIEHVEILCIYSSLNPWILKIELRIKWVLILQNETTSTVDQIFPKIFRTIKKSRRTKYSFHLIG